MQKFITKESSQTLCSFRKEVCSRKLSLRREYMTQHFERKRENLYNQIFTTESWYNDVVSLSRQATDGTLTQNELNTLLTYIPHISPYLHSAIRCFNIEMIQILLPLFTFLSESVDNSIAKLLHNNNIILTIRELIDLINKHYDIFLIREIIILSGNIAVEDINYRKELIDIGMLTFALDLNAKLERSPVDQINFPYVKNNLFWLISNIVKNVQFDKNKDIEIYKLLTFAIQKINVDINYNNELDSSYLLYMIKTLYFLYESNELYQFFAKYEIFQRLLKILLDANANLLIYPHAEGNKRIVLFIFDIIEYLTSKFDKDITLQEYILNETDLIKVLCEILSSSNLYGTNQTKKICYIIDDLTTLNDCWVDEFFKYDDLLNYLLDEEQFFDEAFITLTYLTKTNNEDNMNKLIDRGIVDKLFCYLKRSGEIKSEIDTICFAYEAFENLIHYYFNDHIQLYNFIIDCQNNGIRDKIERDSCLIDPNYSKIQKRANKIIMMFELAEEMRERYYERYY